MSRSPILHVGLFLALVACGTGRDVASPDAGAQGGAGAGGRSQAGGIDGSGGSVGSGGVSASGGFVGTGGASASGGVSGSGGTAARDAGSTGGTGSGGSTVPDASPDGSADVSLGDDGGRDKLDASAPGPDSASSFCPAGWQLAWNDEFDGAAGASADGNSWVYETGAGGWGNAELEYYRAQNGVLDGNGNLVITAKQESYGGASYTSARLKTQGKKDWTYGHIESRIKIPYGQGIWPAFWLLGSDINTNNWPGCGEIDVMENIGKEPNLVHGTIHGPGYSGGAGPTATYTLQGGGRFADDFHVFAIEWEESVIRWYVDGTLYSTKTPTDVGSGNTWVYGHPFFILLNLAVGGGWPGNPDGTTVFPQTMTVDYVRVCRR